MLDLSLFRRPAMVGVSIATFCVAASIFAMFLYLTLYVQDVLGYGPFTAGLIFLPLTMMAFIVAPFAGRLTVRMQSRYLMGTGMLLVAVGCFLMSDIHATSAWTVLLPGFIVCGIGIGVANPVIASASVAVVPHQRSGMASGSSNTFRQVGIATGIAALGAIFQSQVQSGTMRALAASATGREVATRGGSQLSAAITGGGVREAARAIPVASARQSLLDAYRLGFTTTFNHLMTISTVVALVGSLAAYALVRQRDFVAAQGHAPAGAAPGAATPAGAAQPDPAPAT